MEFVSSQKLLFSLAFSVAMLLLWCFVVLVNAKAWLVHSFSLQFFIWKLDCRHSAYHPVCCVFWTGGEEIVLILQRFQMKTGFFNSKISMWWVVVDVVQEPHTLTYLDTQGVIPPVNSDWSEKGDTWTTTSLTAEIKNIWIFGLNISGLNLLGWGH